MRRHGQDGERVVDAGMCFARGWRHGNGRAVDDPKSQVHIVTEALADGCSIHPVRVDDVQWVDGDG